MSTKSLPDTPKEAATSEVPAVLTVVETRTAREIASAVLSTMRPRQWTKNLILFAAPLFAGSLTQPGAILRSSAAFVLFCLLSGAVYLMNDVRDRENDRAHEVKRLRPVAAGILPVRVALAASVGTIVVACGLALLVRPLFAAACLAFVALQLGYSLRLKHEVVLDVMVIALGFVLRAAAGAVAIAVEISPWLLLCTFLLALFLALAKRRHELLLLESDAQAHRASLGHYTTPLIDSMLASTTAATIVSYALYTFFSRTAEHRPYMMVTVPFVAYGLFRYLYLVHRKSLGGSPEEILLTDAPLIADIVLWALAAAAIMYLT